jgi:predicted nicotinamide N-methyase
VEAHLQDGGRQVAAQAFVNRRQFILDNTSILSPPLVPEVRLHLAHEAVPLWQKTEEELGEMGLPPPFWAFAWAGGQALARYLLDNPALVEGKRVIDVATGSGLVGIAAMKAGAASVLATEVDGFAVRAAEMNAALNGVELEIVQADLLLDPPPPADLICVGDLFYEKSLAARCLSWLRQSEAETLVGDPGRSYLPKEQLEKLIEYSVPVTRDLEDAEIKRSAVWRLKM